MVSSAAMAVAADIMPRPQSSAMGEAAKNYVYDVAEAKALFSAAGVDSIDVPMHFSSNVYTIVVPYY